MMKIKLKMSFKIFLKSKILVFLLFLGACSFNKYQKRLSSSKDKFILTDKAGKFSLVRESGFGSNKRTLVVKQEIFQDINEKNILEQNLIISVPGFIRGKIRTLRPKKSLYNVWFEGKKYSTEMDINLKNKSLSISMKSPEKQWNGQREIPFPENTGPFCFFGQFVECLRTIGFLDKLENGRKKKIYIIWESYPYIQEQYLNLPNEVFSSAEVIYDGKNEQGENRITLEVGGQVIFYLLGKNGELNKIFWVVQGLSIVKEK